MPSQFEAWLIPHLMAKSSASVLVMWTAWWMVLVMGLLWVCICNIDIAMSFLMLASVTIMTVEGEFDDSIIMLLSCWVWLLLFFCLLCKLNKNQSEKLSIILWLWENSEWKGVKEEKIPLHLLTISTKWLLMRKYWRLVRKSSEAECCKVDTLRDESMSNQMRWLEGIRIENNGLGFYFIFLLFSYFLIFFYLI